MCLVDETDPLRAVSFLTNHSMTNSLYYQNLLLVDRSESFFPKITMYRYRLQFLVSCFSTSPQRHNVLLDDFRYLLVQESILAEKLHICDVMDYDGLKQITEETSKETVTRNPTSCSSIINSFQCNRMFCPRWFVGNYDKKSMILCACSTSRSREHSTSENIWKVGLFCSQNNRIFWLSNGRHIHEVCKGTWSFQLSF